MQSDVPEEMNYKFHSTAGYDISRSEIKIKLKYIVLTKKQYFQK